MRTAIYPGSFDPITNGHLDIVQRAARLFDRVVVAVAHNEGKNPLFTPAERLELVRQCVAPMPNVEPDAFSDLLVHYVERRGGQTIIRGLRAVSDFEFEFQLALMNRKLNGKIETIFMMPKETYTFLSSRIVKEIARLGGEVGCFVPAPVQAALARKFAGQPGRARLQGQAGSSLLSGQAGSTVLQGQAGSTVLQEPIRSLGVQTGPLEARSLPAHK